ncbi:LytR C-terminal domain-containing protein [Longispora albida]|uniref:LytR C-terminal domain-containing protein n=1 Tax=Longispora albida TaxID=203523 RepID=UPI0003A76A16|nr:LytR C-terminal domain-containing protein [Longispora albida]
MTLSRVRAFAVVGTLLLVAVIVVTWALMHDKQAGSTSTAKSCPKGYVAVDTRQPPPADIKVNVYNGTDETGVAAKAADGLAKEKFKVLKTDNDPKRKTVKGVVELRYGPKTVGAAHVLRAYFLVDADAPAEFDPKRTDDVVDVVLGAQFKQLGSPTEVKQKISALREPQLPEGTCAGK